MKRVVPNEPRTPCCDVRASVRVCVCVRVRVCVRVCVCVCVRVCLHDHAHSAVTSSFLYLMPHVHLGAVDRARHDSVDVHNVSLRYRVVTQ